MKKVNKCKCGTSMTNLSPPKRSNPNYYCEKCGAHYCNGQFYTKKQWFDWVNGEEEDTNA